MLLRLAGAAVPIRSCSRWGLPCRPCCQGRGALLPPRFALARGLPYDACAGGLFSVALSLGSPPPDVIRHRIPVEPGLSSTALRRQRPSGRLTCGQMAAVLGGRQAGYVPCLASEISIGAAHTTVGVHQRSLSLHRRRIWALAMAYWAAGVHRGAISACPSGGIFFDAATDTARLHAGAPLGGGLTLRAKSDRSHLTADASALDHRSNRSNSSRMMR